MWLFSADCFDLETEMQCNLTENTESLMMLHDELPVLHFHLSSDTLSLAAPSNTSISNDRPSSNVLTQSQGRLTYFRGDLIMQECLEWASMKLYSFLCCLLNICVNIRIKVWFISVILWPTPVPVTLSLKHGQAYPAWWN